MYALFLAPRTDWTALAGHLLRYRYTRHVRHTGPAPLRAALGSTA